MKEKYKAEGWALHHHLLEYDEPNAENPMPSILAKVAEPADDEEKNWKVFITGTSEVSCVFVAFYCLNSYRTKLLS